MVGPAGPDQRGRRRRPAARRSWCPAPASSRRRAPTSLVAGAVSTVSGPVIEPDHSASPVASPVPATAMHAGLAGRVPDLGRTPDGARRCRCRRSPRRPWRTRSPGPRPARRCCRLPPSDRLITWAPWSTAQRTPLRDDRSRRRSGSPGRARGPAGSWRSARCPPRRRRRRCGRRSAPATVVPCPTGSVPPSPLGVDQVEAGQHLAGEVGVGGVDAGVDHRDGDAGAGRVRARRSARVQRARAATARRGPSRRRGAGAATRPARPRPAPPATAGDGRGQQRCGDRRTAPPRPPPSGTGETAPRGCGAVDLGRHEPIRRRTSHSMIGDYSESATCTVA